MKPIIFTHFGHNDYLNYTLSTASKINPNKEIILIGDNKNKFLSKKYNIRFYDMNEILYDELDEFNNSFLEINGKDHNNIKNGKNWLKYVFERWFYVNYVLRKNKIKSFWHFDSDTMVLENLERYEKQLNEYDMTEQCAGNCLNGYIKAKVVQSYCKSILNLFKNEDLIELNRLEFQNFNFKYALTEMRAYIYFKSNSNYKSTSLNIFKERYFDNFLRVPEGFEHFKFMDGKPIKKVLVKNSKFYFIKNGTYYRIVTVNLSWLPIEFFSFFYDSLFNNNKLQIYQYVNKNSSISKKILYILKRIYGKIRF